MRTAKVPLLLRAQSALRMTQRAFGELLGVSSRTLIRWRGNVQRLGPNALRRLAAAVHRVDPELAGEIASHYRTTLEDLGVVVPAPPPLRAAPDVGHLVDSIVCAAAEAMATTPQTVRPALVAAFERAEASRLDVDVVPAALRDP